jgi:hypothetical protein
MDPKQVVYLLTATLSPSDSDRKLAEEHLKKVYKDKKEELSITFGFEFVLKVSEKVAVSTIFTIFSILFVG